MQLLTVFMTAQYIKAQSISVESYVADTGTSYLTQLKLST